MTAQKDAALRLAERGLHVFPCRPRGGTPICSHGCKEATTDPTQIETWWARTPLANIGIATGPEAGIFVLDIDMKGGKDGKSSLRKIEAEHGASLPQTVEAITGSGGRHQYFKWPDFDEAPVLRNSVSKIGDGLDIRASGGYVIAPPSIHPSGKRYAWSVDCAPAFAEAPVWFIALIDRATGTRARPPEHFAELAVGVTEGSRNASLASLCGKLLRVGLPASEVLAYLRYWNQRNQPPLEDERLATAVRNITRLELERLRR